MRKKSTRQALFSWQILYKYSREALRRDQASADSSMLLIRLLQNSPTPQSSMQRAQPRFSSSVRTLKLSTMQIRLCSWTPSWPELMPERGKSLHLAVLAECSRGMNVAIANSLVCQTLKLIRRPSLDHEDQKSLKQPGIAVCQAAGSGIPFKPGRLLPGLSCYLTYWACREALFANEEYEGARESFEAAASLDATKGKYSSWLKKCDAELAGTPTSCLKRPDKFLQALLAPCAGL